MIFRVAPIRTYRILVDTCDKNGGGWGCQDSLADGREQAMGGEGEG